MQLEASLWKTRKDLGHSSVQMNGSGMVLEANDERVIDDVIEACRRGDRDAFRALFETYKDRVYSIALRYSGNSAVAMDIAQDTFLKAFAALKSFKPGTNFARIIFPESNLS